LCARDSLPRARAPRRAIPGHERTMANATSSSTGQANPTVPPTIVVILRCTLPQPLVQHLFAIGARWLRPRRRETPRQWLAAADAPPADAEPTRALAAHLAARLSPCELEIVR
jgi:hypothetical protein